MENVKATRDSFGEVLVDLGRKNSKIVVLDADLSESTRTIMFKREFPERFFDCGIAECNMIGVGAGLATCGKIPFVASFAVFSVARAFEQIRNSVAYSNLNVKIVGSHSGLSAGQDGATHQSFEDLSLMRSLPNMTVVCPCDHFETMAAVSAIVDMKGPVYLRLSKLEVGLVYDVSYLENFRLGKGVILKNGTDLILVATGIMVFTAMDVAKLLQQSGLSVGVVNIHTLKPFDEELILQLAYRTKLIVCLEEHSVIGGLGDAVCGAVCSAGILSRLIIKKIGLNDEFGQSGVVHDLLRHYCLDVAGVLQKVKAFVKQFLNIEV